MSSFSEWSRTGLGQSLYAIEQTVLEKFLPDLKGDIAVQYSHAGSPALLNASGIEGRFLALANNRPVLNGSAGGGDDLQILYVDESSPLPFLSSSVDLCLLPHMLEFSDNPHQLLRESKEVLVSGGHLVILGFNPFSLWGVRKYFSRGGAPWNGRSHSVYKVRDWLSLLDFQICGGMMLYYSPPVSNSRLRGHFGFMEKAGDRWWPMLGGVYLLIARKREAGMTVIDIGEKVKKRAFMGIAEPVAKTGVNYQNNQ